MGTIQLPEIEKHLRELASYLSEIYGSLDHALAIAEGYLRSLKDVQEILERISQSCQSDFLKELSNTVLELHKKLDDVHSALHPHLLREVKQDLRRCEKRLQAGIKQEEHLRSQVNAMQMRLAELLALANDVYKHLSVRLKPMDDTATVMQRQLTHLEEFLKSQPPSHKNTAQIIGNILVLSLQLATLIFPVGRGAEEGEVNISLQKAMAEWVRNLANYLSEMAKYAYRIKRETRMDYIQELKDSLESLRRACEEMSHSTADERNLGENSIPEGKKDEG